MYILTSILLVAVGWSNLHQLAPREEFSNSDGLQDDPSKERAQHLQIQICDIPVKIPVRDEVVVDLLRPFHGTHCWLEVSLVWQSHSICSLTRRVEDACVVKLPLDQLLRVR